MDAVRLPAKLGGARAPPPPLFRHPCNVVIDTMAPTTDFNAVINITLPTSSGKESGLK